MTAGNKHDENTPNILIVNSFKDVDKPIDWGSVDDLFPDVKMEDIQTWTLSSNTDHVFLHTLDNHIQVDNQEFNFVRIISSLSGRISGGKNWWRWPN